MGKLLKRRSREEIRRIERERREALLDAAARCFVHLPYSEVTLAAIGKRAGVAKGIAAMYFDNKDELYLQVLRSSLETWFDEITSDLGSSEEPLEPATLARTISESLARQERLVRFLGLLHRVFEREVDVVSAMALTTWLRERADALGEIMERRCPTLESGDGARFLMRLQFLVAGIPRMPSVSAVFATALGEAVPEAVDVDYSKALQELAVLLMPGARGREKAR
jgi:AcrR family transcriptional regulator